MKALDLYKFVNINHVEYHWHDEDVVMFVNNMDIDEWNKLLGCNILDEEGLPCIMKDGYFVYHMKDICDHFDIEMSEVFESDE